jgi:hypothetical protein
LCEPKAALRERKSDPVNRYRLGGLERPLEEATATIVTKTRLLERLSAQDLELPQWRRDP